MDCCDPNVYDAQFDAKKAERKLRDYQRHGATGSTAKLIAGLAEGGVDGLTVLEIGAGVGAVHQALLTAGAATATDIDASGPYLEVARGEAERRGLGDRVTFLKGDAAVVAETLPVADLVALDRVVCCYPDMGRLVRVASERTGRRLGMVLPNDGAWIRAGISVGNRLSAVRHDPFRAYVHRIDAVLDVAAAAGLRLATVHRDLFWRTLILERPPA